jgi:hypothetical protein
LKGLNEDFNCWRGALGLGEIRTSLVLKTITIKSHKISPEKAFAKSFEGLSKAFKSLEKAFGRSLKGLQKEKSYRG